MLHFPLKISLCTISGVLPWPRRRFSPATQLAIRWWRATRPLRHARWSADRAEQSRRIIIAASRQRAFQKSSKSNAVARQLPGWKSHSGRPRLQNPSTSAKHKKAGNVKGENSNSNSNTCTALLCHHVSLARSAISPHLLGTERCYWQQALASHKAEISVHMEDPKIAHNKDTA